MAQRFVSAPSVGVIACLLSGGDEMPIGLDGVVFRVCASLLLDVTELGRCAECGRGQRGVELVVWFSTDFSLIN
jgi:hypothetical protein